jgi:hypothetical protein
MTSWGLGEAETAARGIYLARDLFAKALAVWRLTFVPRATDMLSVPLAGRFYRAATIEF